MPKFLEQNRELFALVGMLFAVLVLMSALSPDRFLTPGNFRSMALQLPEIGLFTLGMMTVMLHGGINLAIIGTANITGIITALVVHAVQPEGGEWPAIVTGVLAGFGVSLLIGLANGIIVGYIGISSILTTLGMMTLVNGTCILITGGSTISRLPAPLLLIGNGSVLGIPVPLLLFLVSAMILALLLRRTTFGFNLYMLGTNPIATRFAGIDNARTLLFAYLLSSVFASIAGLVMMARFNSAKADYGQSYLLISVLAAVLGGTNASGGYGKVAGVVVAVVMLQMIASGLNLLGMDPFFAIMMWGVILLLVMTINHFLKHRT
jgi:simple sugar transport system permease protein